MNDNYGKAYTEVLEILRYFSEEEYLKIPREKVNFYKEHRDKEYIFKINPNIDLAEQNISKETYAILSSIFIDYFATDKQKETLNKLLAQNEEKQEEIKREKYNIENLFKIEKQESYKENEIDSKAELVKYKETLFNKFINYIKKLLKWN